MFCILIQLTNCDCENGLKLCDTESVDLIVTSPPYDSLRQYDNDFMWSYDKFMNVALELSRVLKKGGILVWIVNDATVNGSETLTSFKQALFFKEECGLNVHDTMIWQKPSPFTHKNRYISDFEYMFVFSKGRPKTTNIIKDRPNKYAGTMIHGTLQQKNDGKLVEVNGKKKARIVQPFGARYNVWNISGNTQNKTGHPAVFPVNLVCDHIVSWSNEGDVVLDPFMGSGTTGVAAKRLNRNFIGFEISKRYFEIAKQQIDNA